MPRIFVISKVVGQNFDEFSFNWNGYLYGKSKRTFFLGYYPYPALDSVPVARLLLCQTWEAKLNLKRSETFQDILICQYRELIHEAILESETDHKTRLNLGKLNSKLKVICKAAQYDGLPETVVDQLIDEAIPSSKAA